MSSLAPPAPSPVTSEEYSFPNRLGMLRTSHAAMVKAHPCLKIDFQVYLRNDGAVLNIDLDRCDELLPRTRGPLNDSITKPKQVFKYFGVQGFGSSMDDGLDQRQKMQNWTSRLGPSTRVPPNCCRTHAIPHQQPTRNDPPT